MFFTSSLLIAGLMSFGQASNEFQTIKKEKKPLKFLLGGALEFGGDDVAEIYFVDGSTQRMNAGQGGTLYAGGQLQLDKKEQLFLRTSVGIKYLTTKAENAHIRLTRFPVQASINYFPAKKLRIGVGIVSHQGIRLNFDGIGDNQKFTAGPGPVLEIAYAGVGLSYTVLTYKDTDKNAYSANSIGITFSGVF